MIKPLTSLRFFFAIMVFLSHLPIIDSTNSALTYIQNNIFFEGYLGVSFFFILSGFILSYTYKDRILNNQIPFREFWIARVARIYPLHLLTLFVAVPLSLGGMLASPIVWFLKLLTNALLLQSFIPVQSVFFSFNAPSWSISDEMFFYLLFPFIISAFIKIPKLQFINLLLLLFIPIGILICPDVLEHRLFYINPILRLADFTIGILLYNLFKKISKSHYTVQPLIFTLLEVMALCSFALFLCLHSYIPQGYRYSCYYWLPMIFIILIFSFQSGYLSKVLSHRKLMLLGEISFGFYLIHQLSIKYVTYINNKLVIIDDDYLLTLIIFIATLSVSYFTYKFVELPSNKYIKTRYLPSRNVIHARGLKD